jgi:hypothetical protein
MKVFPHVHRRGAGSILGQPGTGYVAVPNRGDVPDGMQPGYLPVLPSGWIFPAFPKAGVFEDELQVLSGEQPAEKPTPWSRGNTARDLPRLYS